MIGFWKTSTGSQFMSSAKGLTKEQIEHLHSLQEGDILVLFPCDSDKNATNRAFDLKKSKISNKEETPF